MCEVLKRIRMLFVVGLPLVTFSIRPPTGRAPEEGMYAKLSSGILTFIQSFGAYR